MKLDVTVHTGNKTNPVVIFIHGLAVDRDIWINPLDTKVFARSIPLKHLSATRPRATSRRHKKIISTGIVPVRIDSLWSRLAKEGFNLICWSQRRPVGPIHLAVEELKEVMAMANRLFPRYPIALIGHSRGGLVARKCTETTFSHIKALITIASPHAGSSLSKVGRYVTPLHGVIKSLLPKETHSTAYKILKRIHDLIEGNALKELMPGSDFFKNLKDSPIKDIEYLSFGGEKTELITIYKWQRRDAKMYPKKLLIIPDSLLAFIPDSVIPDELRPGRGDIMVTSSSSVLPWASRHLNLKSNHFTIMWNKKVIQETLELLTRI